MSQNSIPLKETLLDAKLGTFYWQLKISSSVLHINQGNYIKELTSELGRLIGFLHYTFSFKLVSEIDDSNNFWSLFTAKSFLNRKVVLNSRQLSMLNAYSSIFCLQTDSNELNSSVSYYIPFKKQDVRWKISLQLFGSSFPLI